jgi:hypothetical protein
MRTAATAPTTPASEKTIAIKISRKGMSPRSVACAVACVRATAA